LPGLPGRHPAGDGQKPGRSEERNPTPGTAEAQPAADGSFRRW